jgi:hypothetical protein
MLIIYSFIYILTWEFVIQETPLLSNHLQQLIEFVLIVSRNNQYDDSVRVIALQFLIWVTN